ncbi:MAG TPA: hypothetical protein DD727_05875, partial [Clostridiales bacterium]|nr:hypothetical protein [Clostridiales bacterium]
MSDTVNTYGVGNLLSKKDNLLRAIRHERPDWVPNGMENVILVGPPIIERPGRAGFDDFGVQWAFAEGAKGGTYPVAGGHTIHDIRKWREQIHLPDVDARDWSRAREKAEGVDREQFLVEGFVEFGLFERSYLLFGMEEALVLYLEEPEMMKEVIEELADYKIQLIRKFHETAKLDMIWYGDDWGTQTNLFLPESVWREV